MSASWLIKVLILHHRFERFRDARCGFLCPERAVFRGCRIGVAHHATGSDVAGQPSKGCGGIFREQQLRIAYLSDVVDGVGRGVDELGCRAEQECGFDLSSVEAVSFFLRAYAVEADASRAVKGEGTQAELSAEIAGHHVDQ